MWKQGSDFGLSNTSRQMEQVVKSVVTDAVVAIMLSRTSSPAAFDVCK